MDPRPSFDDTILRALDRSFSPAQPAARFALRVLLVSLAGLAAAVALYVAASPGMGRHLLASEAAGGRFVRQIATNGLPVVFAVNWAGFLLYARLRAGRADPLPLAALDLALRLALFFGLHAAIFAVSACAFGSFGGDPVQALRAVGPTLAQAAAFGNLSGAYLYATILSALPLHMAALARLLPRRPREGGLLALALLAFVLQAAALRALAALVTALQGPAV